MTILNIPELLNIAESAANILMEYYELQDKSIEIKSDNSPVTIADKKASDFIVASLHKLTRKIPVVSEENPEQENLDIIHSASTFWLIDPLDGTWSYIKKRGFFTVNIALIDNGKPIWGLINSPLHDSTYFIDQKQTYKKSGNKVKLIKANCKTADGIDFLVSHQNLDQRTQDFISHYKVKTITPIPSSYKLALMAEGQGHIYPRFKDTCIWDTAAGHALLKAQGGNIVDTFGKELCYNKGNIINPNFIAHVGLPIASTMLMYQISD